ncbi:hypothetical protein SETIT_9G124700v2 [Setaria italica]|uniref:DUF6598 domain-containing protein n=1 Tax=Setaria italica TaxID=4555 RepID=A0A368SHL2_SETIT|nr:hypothetical protein SETIT_9G124700v2 [Setaria italica]
MEGDAAEEHWQVKRPAEDDAEGSASAKRPKPPPSPTEWWKDETTASLIGVREEQATLYDPRRRNFRCCRGFDRNVCEPAVFDHEEESTARIARPLDTIPDSELDHLKLALNVIHVKVLASDVGFPISAYGTVLMRDDLDFKCIYLFQPGRDNCQVINSPGDMLALTGPNRGPFEADTFYFEINLKVRGEEQTMDRIFSRSLIDEDYPLGPRTKDATVGVNILRGPREFSGSWVACTSEDPSEMVLYDSEHGSVALTRPLAIVREDEYLVLKLTPSKLKTTVLTVEHSDRSLHIRHGRYKLQVTISWSGIYTDYN